MPKPRNIPDEAWRIYERVMDELARDRPDLSDEDRAKRAWGAVKNAGWHKKGERWVKSGRSMSGGAGANAVSLMEDVIAQFVEVVTKEGLPARCWAYVPDPKKPSSWKLQYRNPDGSVDKDHLAKAAAAFSSGGFRGKRVQIPAQDVAGVKAKLRAAYGEIGKRDDDIPKQLFSEGGASMREIRGLPVFCEGTHQGDGMDTPEEFDAAFLDDLMSATFAWQKETKQVPKVFITHDETLQGKFAEELGLGDVLCFGQVSGLYTGFSASDDGTPVKTLFADLENVPDEVADLMDNKQLPDRSIRISNWNGRPVVSHLGLLGVEMPAVKGLNDRKIGAFSGLDNSFDVQFSAIAEAKKKGGRSTGVKGVISRMLNKGKKQNGGGNGDQLPAGADFEAVLGQFEDRMTKLIDRRIVGFERSQRARDDAAYQQEVKDFLDKVFSKTEGVVLAPACRPRIEALFNAVDRSLEVQFSEGAGKDPRKVRAVDLLKEFVENAEFLDLDEKTMTFRAPRQDGAPEDNTKLGREIAHRQFSVGGLKDEDQKTVTLIAAALKAAGVGEKGDTKE